MIRKRDLSRKGAGWGAQATFQGKLPIVLWVGAHFNGEALKYLKMREEARESGDLHLF